MAKKKTSVPTEETPAQRFKRVIEPRVGKALKAIRLVGSVTGSPYKYTEEDVANITSALMTEVEKTSQRLKGTGDKTSGFSL